MFYHFDQCWPYLTIFTLLFGVRPSIKNNPAFVFLFVFVFLFYLYLYFFAFYFVFVFVYVFLFVFVFVFVFVSFFVFVFVFVFESPPLTSGHPKFENPPSKRLEIPTLRSYISETEQNEPQKNYCWLCVTHQTEHFWKHRKNFTRYVLGPQKSRPRISSESHGIGWGSMGHFFRMSQTIFLTTPVGLR